MAYYSPEDVAKVREVDLLSFLQVTDPKELIRCDGGEYCTRTHDSLKISNGKWFWWSRGIGGASALDYLVKVKGMEFTAAVETVLSTRLEAVIVPPVFVSAQKKKRIYDRLFLPSHTFLCRRAKMYLLNRGIDETVIDDSIRRKMVAEVVKDGAVLFLGYDEKGTVKHACSRATDGSSGKKDMAGSDKRYAFKLATNEANPTVRVFESAIDLLSYATMLKMVGRDYRMENLISLSGIYLPRGKVEETKIPLPLEHYLATRPNTERICLYLDNDYAGHRGADALQIRLGSRYEVRYLPPPVGKDYNDYLLKKTEGPSKGMGGERDGGLCHGKQMLRSCETQEK